MIGDSFKSWLVFVAAVSALVNGSCKNSSPIERLAHATREAGRRQTEARISGLPYAPYLAPARSAISKTHGAAAESLTSSKDRHMRGVAMLIVGDSSKAIETLVAAASERSNDPHVWNDLAAARYEHACQKDDVAELVWALAAANHALSIDATMPEAALNRAMILEALQLDTLAKRGYTSYLTFERNPEWIEEGRRRLAALEALAPKETWKTEQPKLEAACAAGRQAQANAIVAFFPQDARSWAEGIYLAQWGEGGNSAATSLTIARCIGVGLKNFSGERLLSDAVDAIDRSKDTSVLAHAHVTYKQARIAYMRRMLADAAPLFAEARSAFQRSRSPMELLVRYYEANIAYDRNNSVEALAKLDAVAAETPAAYRSLHAQMEAEKCLALSRLGRLYEALVSAERSAADFEALGEQDLATRVRGSIASLLASLGRAGDAWRVRRQLFRIASHTRDHPILEGALNAAAADELFAGRWETAAALYHEQAKLPNASVILRTDALLWSALANGRAGLKDTALDGIAAAKSNALAITDADLKLAALDDIRFGEAILIGDFDPRGAEQRLTESIALRRSKHLVDHLPEAYVARSKFRVAIGDKAGAIADLDNAIAILTEQPVTIEHDLRDSFFGTAAVAFDGAIALQAMHGNEERAFALAEVALSRALLARLALESNSKAATIDKIRSKLPSGTVLVQYTSLPRQTLAIVVDRIGSRAVFLGISRNDIDRRRSAFTDAIARNDDSAITREGRALHDALIAPLSNDLRGADTLIVTADAHVASIPFAGLRDSTTNQFLIERYVIVMAPSATLYARMDGFASRAKPPRHALVLGDPAFDEARFATLPQLPGARDEAMRIAELYPGTTALIGADASKARFIDAATSADVMHLAVHGIDNEADPLLSAIPLAATLTDTGVLTVREAAELQLTRNPVVMLAACRSAVRSSGNRPIRNFALAFVAAGSRAVIGSLWDVDDDATRALSLDVHKQLRAGTSPARALRHAQLMMMRSEVAAELSLRAWSGFQSFGVN